MNSKCRKLKTVESVIKPRKSGILARPKFSRHPVYKRKKIEKILPTSLPIEVDVTGDVLLGLALAGPAGALAGAMIRPFSHIGVEGIKTIQDTAEKGIEAREEKSDG